MPMHVIQRGNNRDATFRVPSDYMRYRDILHAASQRSRCAIHAYVLMTNHVHMLLTPEEDDGPSRMMQLIGSRYVPYVNSRVPRTGTLWEGRYRSSLVNSDRYLFTCSRYIELNPVRARMTDDPGHYLWSSYLHNARGVHDPLITPHDLYRGLERACRSAGSLSRPVRGRSETGSAGCNPTSRQHGDLLGDDGFVRR
jgi:putative transposase